MRNFRKAALIAASSLAFAGTAAADCGGNGTYCSMSAYEGGSSHSSHSSSSYVSPSYTTSSVSSYDMPAYASSSSYDAGETVVSGSTYSSVSAPVSYSSSSSTYSSYSTPSTSYAGSLSDSYADATYGSGSISQAYEDTSYVPFSGGSLTSSGTISGLSVAGMGANEELCPVDCAQPVGSTGSGRVLGCYAVCKPAPQPVTYTTYTQVVRPVIYVRYPVPYAVPYTVPGNVHFSRYADHAHRGGYAPNCSYDYGYHGHAGARGYGCR